MDLGHQATYRTKILQGLHQVFSHAIGAIIPGGWEQTDEIEVEGST
jgi:hypothetical protein